MDAIDATGYGLTSASQPHMRQRRRITERLRIGNT
jgi:hypothetical protein